MITYMKSPYFASRLDLFANELLEKTKTGARDFLFIEPYSAGDVFHTLSFINEFRRVHCTDGQKINFICNERGIGVVKLFRNVDLAMSMNLLPLEFHLESLVQRFPALQSGVPIITCPDMYSRGFLARLYLENLINGLTCRKLIMELDLKFRPELPNLDDNLANLSIKKAQRFGINSGSILIFNHASSMKSLDPEVFDCLKKYAGRVFYDASKSGHGVIPWAIPIHLSIEDVPYFANYAGTVISIRSGLTDVLSLSKANIITIYPNEDHLHDWHGDKKKVAMNYKGYTLEKFEIGSRANEIPIFCESGEGNQDIKLKLDKAISSLSAFV